MALALFLPTLFAILPAAPFYIYTITTSLIEHHLIECGSLILTVLSPVFAPAHVISVQLLQLGAAVCSQISSSPVLLPAVVPAKLPTFYTKPWFCQGF